MPNPLVDVVATAIADVRAMETLLTHFLASTAEHNPSTDDYLRSISESAHAIVLKRRAQHLYTEKSAEQVRIGIDRIIACVAEQMQDKRRAR